MIGGPTRINQEKISREIPGTNMDQIDQGLDSTGTAVFLKATLI